MRADLPQSLPLPCSEFGGAVLLRDLARLAARRRGTHISLAETHRPAIDRTGAEMMGRRPDGQSSACLAQCRRARNACAPTRRVRRTFCWVRIGFDNSFSLLRFIIRGGRSTAM